MKSKPPSKKSRTDSTAETSFSALRKDSSPSLKNVKASIMATASEIVSSKSSSSTTSTPPPDVTSPAFPTLSVQELISPRDFPRLSDIIAATKETVSTRLSDVIALDDIDTVQLELETLWSNLSVRIRCLQKEQSALFTFDRASSDRANNEARSSGSKSLSVSSPKSSPRTARKANALNAVLSATAMKLEKPKKKLKGDGDSKSKRGSEKPARSGQNRSHLLHNGGSSLSYRQAPNQFWDFADTYCREINYQDLDGLEKLIEEHSSLPNDLFEIPPLGPHFRDAGSASSTRTRDRVETRSQDVCGPLTQRLVSALVDNRISSYQNGMGGTSSSPDVSAEGVFVNRPGLMTALGLDGGRSPGQSLESRLRQVLIEQGLLANETEEAAGPEADDPRDEILADIKRTQAQLRQLHQHNEDKLKQLYFFAKRELDRVGAKRDLEKADKELLEAYRIVCLSRGKKKPLSKREREVASRALENRRSALERLQVSPHPEERADDSYPSERIETEEDPPNSTGNNV